MIRIRDLTYGYDRESTPVLNRINLTIKQGETLCVMGSNGSGKTTLARIIAGLIETDSSSIDLAGERAGRVPVGILFQNPDNQMVAVTVQKEIAFALENCGTPLAEMEKRVTDTLKQFSISHLARRLTSDLSGGEKQRVALASVMISRPPILVLDEPDSFLDEVGKQALSEELKRIQRDVPETTIIHITQYPHVARNYPRLLVIHDGSVIYDGVPEQFLADRHRRHQAGLCYMLDGSGHVEVPESGVELAGSEVSVTTIRLSDVGFSYPGQDSIFAGLNMDIGRGEILGVVGPSGCGKSTLGLLLCGLFDPSNGRVEYLDNNGCAVDRKILTGQVSTVLQQPERQFFLPTCADEVAFGPNNLERPLSDEQISAHIHMVGLSHSDFAHRDPYTLSAGEKRRLAFAAVLSMAPRFVIFDEPTCGLDPEGTGRFVLMARQLRDRGMGLTIITHDGNIINRLADRVLHMSGDGGYELMTRSEFFSGGRADGVVSPPEVEPEDTETN